MNLFKGVAVNTWRKLIWSSLAPKDGDLLRYRRYFLVFFAITVVVIEVAPEVLKMTYG